jgi:hypothetical protein
MTALLPYVGESKEVFSNRDKGPIVIGVYLSPADPSPNETNRGPTSYAWNWQAFKDPPSLGASFQDGASNTIAVAEHYQNCDQTNFIFSLPFYVTAASRRAAFADENDTFNGRFMKLRDNQPVTAGDPPVTTGSLPGTFQAAPALKDCDMRYPQGLHPTGMHVAMADASVRFLAPNISAASFWSAVTPSGGEAIGVDW